MRLPILVISYGSFVQTAKLFFYEIGGIGCMPIFTDATVASLFLASVQSRMGDLLADKPPLKIVACPNKQHASDMFKAVSMFTPDVRLIELNPLPLTDKHKHKLQALGITFDSFKYELPELIELLQK
jgi:hypothetical protein